MALFWVATLVLAQVGADLPSWQFAADDARRAWTPNAQIANVRVEDGSLACDTIDSDPFFTCAGFSVAATPWQCVVLRLRANKPGAGELYWTGTEEGPYKGFHWEKLAPFSVKGTGQWETITVFPFWQSEKAIHKLRLDLYDNAHFAIESIRIVSWADDVKAASANSEWVFDNATAWRPVPESATYMIPVNMPTSGKNWAVLRIKSTRDEMASLLWGTRDARGCMSEDIALRGDGQLHYYNVELRGNPAWKGTLAAVGMRLPDEGVTLESLALANTPGGPAECIAEYFGPESGVNRAGAPCRMILQLANTGGMAMNAVSAALTLPEGWRFVDAGTTLQSLDVLAAGERKTLTWTAIPASPGEYGVKVVVAGGAAPLEQTATVSVTAPLGLPKADYVPTPQPVRSSIDVMAYYFPGWDTPAKWDPIHRTAPVRRPLLGYYDEGQAEVVDWQIKWAVEHGITGFLVDWYWNKGNQTLGQWFSAYRNARYRDQLKVAIMWANHGPSGQHSAADWQAVTQHWLDNYFILPGYYRIDGKPAVFIWDTDLVRSDLGGSDGVRAVFGASQEAAKAKGFPGIAYVALGVKLSAASAALLTQEGYVGYTQYHEWGTARDEAQAQGIKRVDYAAVVQSQPAVWNAKQAASGALMYYPTVDTGWDDRPWNGSRGFAIAGRTPERFEQLLRKAKDFCVAQGKPMVVLGPVNEWGEGSYIEPCAEFGFAMYDRVRAVFGTGDSASWPQNVAPSDIGLGPYDFGKQGSATTWTFNGGMDGWTSIMNTADLRAEGGVLRFRTTSSDPALAGPTLALSADKVKRCVITMRVTGPLSPNASGQLYWAVDNAAPSETTSARFFLEHNGAMHTYAIDFSKNPLWRGTITALRLDPCESANVDVAIDEIRFEP